MTGLDGSRRYSRPERNAGYLIATASFGALWVLINQAPGWQAVPLLSAEFTQVLPLVNVTIAAGAAANVALIAYDRRWFKAALGLVIAGLGIAVSLRCLRVFPFSFATVPYDLTTHAFIVVLVCLVTAAVLAIVHLIALGSAALRATSST